MDGLYNCINYVSGRASALPYCNIIPSNGKHTPRGCNMYSRNDDLCSKQLSPYNLLQNENFQKIKTVPESTHRDLHIHLFIWKIKNLGKNDLTCYC